MEYLVYILYSPSADRYYVGHTHDIDARLKDHNESERPYQATKYTFKHRPWELKAVFPIGPSRALAMQVERYIKRQKSRKFIEQLIDAKDDPERWARLVRVPAGRD
ncbi:MAG: GIY-YIG nuclease family protein [Bacteroidetes bacterium]|nr:MAG: GIY-YIG nuclease family protein [Bacteroidota bacterium]